MLLVALCACQDKTTSKSQPAIRVCTDPTDTRCAPPFVFGTVPIGVAQPVSLWVRNAGGDVLKVSDVALLQGSGVEVVGWPKEVSPGETESIDLRLFAESAGTYQATLAIASNDPILAQRQLALRYVALEAEWQANLVLCPEEGLVTAPPACSDALTVYVGDVRLTDEFDVVVWVYNVGEATAQMRQQLEQGATQAGELEILTPGVGALPVNGQAQFVLRYRPMDALPDSAELRFYDGSNPEAQGTLRVHAGLRANLAPQAQLQAFENNATPVVVTAGRDLWLDGRASQDPEGDPLQFSWSLAASPLAVAWNPSNAKLVALPLNVAGSYVVRLQVADSLGATGSSDLTIEVKPQRRLTATAAWNQSAGDVDLHLVPVGKALFGPSDCSFLQPTPDWGVVAQSVDDFQHLGDNPGEETVGVVEPVPGSYSVYAHFFAPQELGTALVKVSAARDDGAIVLGEVSGVLQNSCDLWLAGTVVWDDAPTFVAASQETTRQCYVTP